MATIDLSDIIDDPDFDMKFQVVQATETVDSHGRATFTNKTCWTHGSVQPSSPRALQMLPEGTRIEGAITVYTTFPLRMNNGTRAADTVIWQGRRYIVSNTQDWSQWGRGFINATCTLHDLLDPASTDDDGDTDDE